MFFQISYPCAHIVLTLGFPSLTGYGLTETCGMCAILPPELLSTGPVGLPAPSVEIKLVDCKESRDLGYEACSVADAKDADGDPVLPQGEIWIRGPSVTKGYFKRPDLNVVANEDGSVPEDADGDPGSDDNQEDKGDEIKEDGKDDKKEKKKPADPVFTRDGWFRTGDVGRWNADGMLSIVDRLKNLEKLQGGEYIALERLEAIYKSYSLVGNLCLYANGDMTQPIAIVVPRKPGTSSNSDKDKILNELVDLGKKNNLSKMETPRHVIVGQEEWTPESGYVTAAQKVQRAKVAEGFKDEIEEFKKAQKEK
ncbi:hypothetical protein D9619_012552 [Psilocybe cf. subviscida]|uniref:AMP-dependent synthetase/ligase domain-containing protein n=1 Tax=Psilocybe cf. subviscida TaxID=2480587 RepID=A0A8H5EZ52_9AGAR|nr:hypothetical protein D9619_012552 [Psilocybe cf. subviscida]